MGDELKLPYGQNVLIRKDFQSDDHWNRVVDSVRSGAGETVFEFADDPRFADLDTLDIAGLIDPTGPQYVLIADSETMASPEMPVLVVDADRTKLRVLPGVLPSVVDNLTVGNLSLAEFGEGAEGDGVLRS